MYYTERKPKSKKRGRPGNEAMCWLHEHMLASFLGPTQQICIMERGQRLIYHTSGVEGGEKVEGNLGGSLMCPIIQEAIHTHVAVFCPIHTGFLPGRGKCQCMQWVHAHVGAFTGVL